MLCHRCCEKLANDFREVKVKSEKLGRNIRVVVVNVVVIKRSTQNVPSTVTKRGVLGDTLDVRGVFLEIDLNIGTVAMRLLTLGLAPEREGGRERGREE